MIQRGRRPKRAGPVPLGDPWELIGPVLPGDRAPKLATLAPDTYPAWAPDATYMAGDTVLYNGLPYAAKWQNEGSPVQLARRPTHQSAAKAARLAAQSSGYQAKPS